MARDSCYKNEVVFITKSARTRVAVHQKLLRHYSATPNTLILVLRDAVEVPVGAEENLTVGNGWRRVARLAQVIHGQKFELLRIGPKNGGDASSARDIQPETFAPAGRPT